MISSTIAAHERRIADVPSGPAPSNSVAASAGAELDRGDAGEHQRDGRDRVERRDAAAGRLGGLRRGGHDDRG